MPCARDPMPAANVRSRATRSCGASGPAACRGAHGRCACRARNGSAAGRVHEHAGASVSSGRRDSASVLAQRLQAALRSRLVAPCHAAGAEEDSWNSPGCRRPSLYQLLPPDTGQDRRRYGYEKCCAILKITGLRSQRRARRPHANNASGRHLPVA